MLDPLPIMASLVGWAAQALERGCSAFSACRTRIGRNSRSTVWGVLGGGDFSSWKAGAESDSVQGAAVSTMNVFPGRCFFSCAPIIFGGPTKTPVHKLRHKSSPGSFA